MPDLTPAAYSQPAEAAVLLVLLPAPAPHADHASEVVPSATLDALQQLLGAAVRVLRINEITHPSVVSSFHATDLPCFVLVQHGVELWRQCGPSNDGLLAPLLLNKLLPPDFANEPGQV